MRDVKRIRQTQRLRWGIALLIFLAVNLVLRLALLPINQAEYTDGILQVTQFSHATGIYPPLYTAIVWPFSLVMNHLWAGRLVSALFSAGAVVPLFLLARRSFGMRAAVFAALVYTVAPTSLRWAPRLMTEAQFSFFFWFACERLIAAQGAKDAETGNRALWQASVFGVLAALTRYQGMMLALPVLIIGLYKWRKRGWFPWVGVASLLLYGLVPLWSVLAGNIHGEQFAERMEILGPWMTFVLSAEPFFLFIPYFLTYPVFFMLVVGLNVGNARKRYGLTPLTLYVLVVLLIAQSLFSSFQERYFLPLFGLLYIWAGLGMAVVDDRCRRKYKRLRPYTPIIIVVWCLFMSTLVLMGSRQAFGDLAQASRYAAQLVDNGEAETIHTNEIYRLGDEARPPIAGTKVAFFAGKEVVYLDESFLTGERRLQPGDLIVLSSRDYPEMILPALRQQYDIETLQTFQASVIPIFPDLMQTRSLEQSPAAWLYRYQPQVFSTTVYRVRR